MALTMSPVCVTATHTEEMRCLKTGAVLNFQSDAGLHIRMDIFECRTCKRQVAVTDAQHYRSEESVHATIQNG